MGGHTIDYVINVSKTSNSDHQPLNFLTLNTCGLKSKLIIPEFCDFISQYDIIGLQETKTNNLDSFEIPGFTTYLKHRKNLSKRKSGGIGIAYRKCLSNYISILENDSKIINGRPRECHNKKAQSIPSTNRKRNLPKTETTKLHVNNSRKASSLFPNRGS